jgi:hypothetical protein
LRRVIDAPSVLSVVVAELIRTNHPSGSRQLMSVEGRGPPRGANRLSAGRSALSRPQGLGTPPAGGGRAETNGTRDRALVCPVARSPRLGKPVSRKQEVVHVGRRAAALFNCAGALSGCRAECGLRSGFCLSGWPQLNDHFP